MGGSGIRASARRRLTRSAFGHSVPPVTALLAVGATIALVTGVLAATGPVSAAASGWHVQHTPNPPAKQGVLAAVSCTSPHACMAVGSHNNGGGIFPLAETWNGTSWSVHRPPAPADAQSTSLLGVSCVLPSACIAVGDYRSAAGIVKTLAETWDGISWSVQPTPNPVGSRYSGLAGVSCTSASACTAVGFAGQFGETLTLAEAWNGTSWSIQPTPNPISPNHAALNGVSCTAPSACTAVGTADGFVTLAEAWNGTSWSIQPTPNPAGATAGSLFGVSCPSAGACFAVGNYRTSSGVHSTLAEAWNGSSWSLKPAPVPAGARRSYLNGVSCTSAGACTAVGNYQSGKRAHLTLAEVWNGTSWSIQATPSPPAPRGGLSAVACRPATFCIAVGGQTSRYQNQTPLALERNGAFWSIRKTPAPPGAARNFLLGVACPAASDCFSVGEAGGDVGTGALIQHWDGSAWSTPRTPIPSGSGNLLAGITCTSAAACTAVGGTFNARGNRTLAERWNGTSWSVQRTPSEPPPQDNELDAVSCPSLSSCVAVGSTGAATAVPLAETWNGTSWSIRMPIADGPGDSTLVGVSCISASDCIAVGSGDNTVTSQVPLAERWDGTSWSVQPVPVPAGTTHSFFQGVSCTSASACTAVGHYDNASGKEFTLAEAWNGTSWSIQPTPNRGIGIAALAGVSCTAPGACTAVGFYDTRSGLVLPLAEVWNGTSWSVQPVPNPQGSTATFLNGVACSPAGVCTAVGGRTHQVNNMGPSSNQTLAEAEP